MNHRKRFKSNSREDLRCTLKHILSRFLLPVFFSSPPICACTQHRNTENNIYNRNHLQSHTLIIIFIIIIIFCGARTSAWPPQNVRENNLSVCVAQLMNPSELDTLRAGQLTAITYTGNQSSSQPRNNSSRPVKSRLVFPQSPSACGYPVLDFILGFACTITDCIQNQQAHMRTINARFLY